MYRSLIAVGALCGLAGPAWSQPAAEANVKSTPPSVSAARIQALREHLQAQVAVYDAAEKLMRAPTADEANALAGTAAESTGRVVALPGGGVAMRADMSNASFLVVQRQPDGKPAVRHASPTSSRPVASAQGGDRVR